MDTNRISLPWGKEQIEIDLPMDWQIYTSGAAGEEPSPADVGQETKASLAAPVASARLADLARPGQKIALVIDDDSRPTPVALIIPHVLAEIQRGGASLAQITAITALGVHRLMLPEEVRRRLGPAGESLRWENHDCDDAGKLVYLGKTSRSVPVFVNKTVAEADLIVSIGCIEPHAIASFGGGCKNIIPGTAGRATIAANHALNCTPETFNNAGQPIEANPMRLDLEEGVGMIQAPIFIVNAVLNGLLQTVSVVCGHPVQAQRAGSLASSRIHGVPLPYLGDVVITTSHPMDIDLRQGVKALANNVRAVRPGGTFIVLVRAEEGLGVFGLANRKLPVGRALLKFLAPLLLLIVPRLALTSMGEEGKFFLYFALQAMRHCNLLLYAPTISPELHANLPFVRFVDGIEEAVSLACETAPVHARVLVFPHGGSSYPILPKE